MNDALFVRLISHDDKEMAITEAIETVKDGQLLHHTMIHLVDPASFYYVPNTPFAYWASKRVLSKFNELPRFETHERKIRLGDHPDDGFRYLRLSWEIPPHTSEHDWFPYQKGGSYSPYYSDIHLLVDWDVSRQTYRDFYGRAGRLNERPSNYQYFFLPGLTWPRRTQRGLSVRILPAGCIFADKGPVIFTGLDTLTRFLGLTNSTAFQGLVSLQMAFGSYEVGVIQRTPVPDLSGNDGITLGNLAFLCVNIKRNLDRVNETSHVFYLPALLSSQGITLKERFLAWQEKVTCAEQQIAQYQSMIDDTVFHLYGIEGADRQAFEESIKNAKSVTDSEEKDEEDTDETEADALSPVSGLLSYMLGCAFGRWDIRFATGEYFAPELPDPFAPLPICSPGMLIGKDGLPLQERPPSYPIDIKWDGILVDDPDHPDDIIRRMHEILTIIWKDNAEAIELEASQILGFKDLREYFRKPGKEGFWMAHIQRYSMSRRKAPIYWLLQSAKRNYALWLYYHRLDKDLFFKVLVNYVEPKLRLEENQLEQVRAQIKAGGLAGREARQLEKQLERQENLLSELHDFRDKLRHVADLGLEPDINDGVVLNIAPLWELVPWNEAKKYWEELLAGRYGWSSIGKQLRAKGII